MKGEDSNGKSGGEGRGRGADELNGTSPSSSSSSSDNDKESTNSSSCTDIMAGTYERFCESITSLSGDAQSVAQGWFSSASSMLEGEAAEKIVSGFHSLQCQWDEQSPTTKKVIIGAGVVCSSQFCL